MSWIVIISDSIMRVIINHKMKETPVVIIALLLKL